MASAIDPLLPPEIFGEEPPLTDDDLGAYFDELDTLDSLVGVDASQRAGALDRHTPAHWSIDGPNTADWAMAKYAAAEASIAELEMRKNEYMLRIGYWFDNAAKDHQRTLEFFAGHLTRYAVDQRIATGGKAKSVKTPSGIVKTTATSPVAEISDMDDVVTWAVAHALDIVKMTQPTVNVTDVRAKVEIIAVPTRVVLSPCACVVDVTGSFNEIHRWDRATAIVCPSCDDDALVGDWLDTRQVIVDGGGNLVPGLVVRDGVITAKVVTSI